MLSVFEQEQKKKKKKKNKKKKNNPIALFSARIGVRDVRAERKRGF